MAILSLCLDATDSKSTVINKVTGMWSSHTDAGKADFQWVICGPYQTAICSESRSWLPQRAVSFLKTRTKGQKDEV